MIDTISLMGIKILYSSAFGILRCVDFTQRSTTTILLKHHIFKNGHLFPFLYLLLLFSPSIQAEQHTKFSISLWPVSASLSQSTVKNTISGKDGTLWILTLDGVNRFDGNSIFEFRTYKTEEGFIASSNILEILEGESGEIFAVTRDAGILVYDDLLNSFTSLQWNDIDPTLEENISAAFSDNKGVLWIGYENGEISLINYRLNSVKHIETSTGVRITDFSQSGSGKVFASTIRGELYQFEHNLAPPEKANMTAECQSNLSNLKQYPRYLTTKFGPEQEDKAFIL